MDSDVSLTTVASTLTDVASSILILFRDAVELCFLVTLFFDGVFTVILPAVDLFFDLVTFDSDIWVSVIFDSKFRDSAAVAVEIADDFFDVVTFDSNIWVSVVFDSKSRASVAFAVVTGDDFFDLVSFDSVVFVSVVFNSKFRDSVAFAEEIADDLVGVVLDFFPSNLD